MRRTPPRRRTPFFPDRQVGRDVDFLLVKNHEGKTYLYPDPLPKI